MAKQLEVKDLRISFRTNKGNVKAVRGINLELEKGDTLAIVGESGSGKSVTARAVLGILAPNAIVEGGEIFYDGKDLLQLSEEEFHLYRGNRVSMIFQDPLSSLNPIIKIGRQLTEAMILNGRADQKLAGEKLNKMLTALENAMNKALCDGKNDAEIKKENKEWISRLKELMLGGAKLEKEYNHAQGSAKEALADIEDMRQEIGSKSPARVLTDIRRLSSLLKNARHKYVLDDFSALEKQIIRLEADGIAYCKSKKPDKVLDGLSSLGELVEKAIERKAPDFYALSYCEKHGFKDTDSDEACIEFLRSDFMDAFLQRAEKGVDWSMERTEKAMEAAVKVLEREKPVFDGKSLKQSEAKAAAKRMIAAVENTIDPLSIAKDSYTYTFSSGINALLSRYSYGIGKNKRENSRFERETAKRERLLAKGKPADHVNPAATVDLELTQESMRRMIKRTTDSYRDKLSLDRSSAGERAEEIVEYLRSCSSESVHYVSPKLARQRALSLMEEVGIPEPRKRYDQYPFEFSGGMRQRIVIAIALSGNPDIIICDEPTTALDVTIQAQILELINKLKVERKLSVIFITHDLGVVANMADKIAVMYAGKIVEYGTAEDIFYRPAHPYTWALLSSMPDLDTKERLEAIPGTPPNMITPPKGDAFAPRNKYAMEIDFEQEPPMFEISDTHSAATWLLHPKAPKCEPPKIVTDRIKRMTTSGGGESEQ